MNKREISLIAVISLLVIGCGGGGNSDNVNNPNIPTNITYACAATAGSKIFFDVEQGTPDYEKKEGVDLVRYFFPKETHKTTPVSDSEIGENEEVNNSYIIREAKAYFFGRGGSFELENSKVFTMQSLLSKWYILGDDFGEYITYRTGDHDNSWQFFTSISELMYGIHNTDFVEFAEVGDTVLSYNFISNDVAMNVAKICTLESSVPTKQVANIQYDDVIELSCTTASTIGETFTGSKLKLLLAKDIGVISQTEDIYVTVIENTQETNRHCTQSVTELTKTKIVQRASESELEAK